MKALADAENGFRFKGIWWTEATFTNVLRAALTLHRAMSNRRVAFHFGVTEKAVRKLRARSRAADGVIMRLTAEAKHGTEKPARYCERDWFYSYPKDREARKILIAAEAERDRQQDIRYVQKKRRKAAGAARIRQIRAQRRTAVQDCKRSGLTQVLTAESLGCSVRTVRRYW
ncbi:hypothetical protein M942_06040 [Enterobacter ludwigii]|jgi:hypothetical protein|uniref:hypothetical protein n=1 Tax=Enterobacter ludwigii TaxID=299767 RepID=UPI0003D80538|nr:hypothetical protein [Enterobacter ludwigii]AHE72701.1 hypothetical protein M942_06040 [Enterobacter ludwigii]